jgi:hypothetical protein
MFRITFVRLFVTSATIVAAIAVVRVWNANRSSESPAIVYVCRETGAVFLGHGEPAPVIHPVTGRATLFPGLYCPQCEKWSPAFPMERLYGNAAMLNCPVCRSPRTFEGKVPDDAEEL